MGSCVSSDQSEFKSKMKTNQKLIDSKQIQLNRLGAEISKKQKTIEFVKNENLFLQEQVNEARSDLWKSEKDRLRSQCKDQVTLNKLEKEIRKMEKMIFEKDQINSLMRNEYTQLSALHDTIMKSKRRRRRNLENSYNTFSDH